MRKFFISIFLTGIFSVQLHAQLAVVKMIGKNAGNSNIGVGVFAYWDIPLNDIGNRSAMIELLDFSYFPPKNSQFDPVVAFLSIRAGYKYIFSEETKTGFYVEPSAGYVRVVNQDNLKTTYGDGVAVAAEAGYTLEVGQRGNNLTFGLKYERDMAGGIHKVSSVGLRFAYAFHLFKKRGD